MLDCEAAEVLIEGPAGTGKTRAILEKINYLATNTPRLRVLICRLTRVSLTESVLVTWERDVLEPDSPARSGGASRANRSSYDYPNKATVVLGGLDNPEKLYSTEWDIVYVPEATEITEDGWEKFARAMRNHVLHYQQQIADCNPGPPNHWLNRRANSGKMVRLISRHEDNPSVTADYLARLRGLSGHRRARLYEGKWVSAEGAVFGDSFTMERNTIDAFQVPQCWPVWVYCDPGENHPCAVGWFTVSLSGKKICFAEIHGRKLGGVVNVARMIKEKNRDLGVDPCGYYLDPRHGFASTFQSTATIAQQFAEAGIPHWQPWGRFQGMGLFASVERVRTAFLAGELLIVNECTGIINDVQSWRYKQNADGSLPKGDDAFEDANNDGCDLLRGFICGRHEKPVIDMTTDEERKVRQFIAEEWPEPSLTRE